jgi:hypothetical protein
MLARYWNAEDERGRAPKTFFKFGASHMARGRDMSECYDVGDLAANIATLEGAASFHILALPAPGSENGQLNPTDFSLVPAPAETLQEEGGKFLADAAVAGAATVIDLRALRPILGYRTAKFDVRATRILHGFDALVILPGTKAAKTF